MSLLNKLGNQYFGIDPVEFEQRRILDPKEIKKLHIDRMWYLNQVQNTFHKSSLMKESAQLLNCLEYAEIIDFMNHKDFNKAILKDCLKLALNSSQNHEEVNLLKATVDCILKSVSSITQRIDSKMNVSSLTFENIIFDG